MPSYTFTNAFMFSFVAAVGVVYYSIYHMVKYVSDNIPSSHYCFVVLTHLL